MILDHYGNEWVFEVIEEQRLGMGFMPTHPSPSARPVPGAEIEYNTEAIGWTLEPYDEESEEL